MNTARLKKIEDLYHRFLEIDLYERESFFDETCGEDIGLRREVESLLSFNKPSDNLLETPPEFLAAEMFSDNDWDNMIGKEVGHYRIQKLLGRGGMGEVYLAIDTKLEREVALKFWR